MRRPDCLQDKVYLTEAAPGLRHIALGQERGRAGRITRRMLMGRPGRSQLCEEVEKASSARAPLYGRADENSFRKN
jgi:hypothetical protein